MQEEKSTQLFPAATKPVTFSPEVERWLAWRDEQMKSLSCDMYFTLLRKKSGYVARDYLRTFEDYHPKNASEKKAKEVVFEAAKLWPKEKHSLFIHSPEGITEDEKYGPGKSHLVKAYGLAVMEKGSEVRYWNIADFIAQLKAAYDKDSEYQTPVVPARECELLIFDDIEKGPWDPQKYGAVWSDIYRVIDYRSNCDLPMAVTSNMTLKALGAVFGGSIEDRLRVCTVVPLAGPSGRHP